MRGVKKGLCGPRLDNFGGWMRVKKGLSLKHLIGKRKYEDPKHLRGVIPVISIGLSFDPKPKWCSRCSQSANLTAGAWLSELQKRTWHMEGWQMGEALLLQVPKLSS